jgi:hypothetical protein
MADVKYMDPRGMDPRGVKIVYANPLVNQRKPRKPKEKPKESQELQAKSK